MGELVCVMRISVHYGGTSAHYEVLVYVMGELVRVMGG